MKDRDRDYIQKRVERAIDAMIDIQDKGYGSYEVQIILDMLNALNIK